MAAPGPTQEQKSAHEHRGMTISVLVADDQPRVRGSFRVLVDTAPT